jgi:hypothetical protein
MVLFLHMLEGIYQKEFIMRNDFSNIYPLRILLIIILGLSSLILTSCKSFQNEILPENIKDVTNQNNDIKLETPNGWNNYLIGDGVNFEAKNISNEPINFKNNFGVKLYIKNGNSWAEVENNTVYPEGDFILFPSNNDPFKTVEISVNPIIVGRESPVILRIYVEGEHLKEDGSLKSRVASYLDIKLSPKR